MLLICFSYLIPGYWLCLDHVLPSFGPISQVYYVHYAHYVRKLANLYIFVNCVILAIRKSMFPICQMYICWPSWIFKMATIKNDFFQISRHIGGIESLLRHSMTDWKTERSKNAMNLNIPFKFICLNMDDN